MNADSPLAWAGRRCPTASAIELLGGLYRLFIEKDSSLANITSLVLTEAGELIALDAKLNFDDNDRTAEEGQPISSTRGEPQTRKKWRRPSN